MKKNGLLWIVGILLVGALLYFSEFKSFSVGFATPPTCTFPDGGGTCVYNITLPEGKAASTYTLHLDFDSTPSQLMSSAGAVAASDSGRYYADGGAPSTPVYEYDYFYLYRVPKGLNANTLTPLVQGAASCMGASSINVNIYTLSHATTGNINECGSSPSACSATYDVTEYQTSTGRQKVSTSATLIATQNFACTNSIINFKLNGTANELSKYASATDDGAILVDIQTLNRPADSISISSNTYSLQYNMNVYPSEVSYKVGSKQIETIAGVQKTNYTTFNIADQINAYCGASSPCKAPVTFTSKSGGLLWVTDKDVVYKLPDGSTGTQSNQTVWFGLAFIGGFVVMRYLLKRK